MHHYLMNSRDLGKFWRDGWIWDESNGEFENGHFLPLEWLHVYSVFDHYLLLSKHGEHD